MIFPCLDCFKNSGSDLNLMPFCNGSSLKLCAEFIVQVRDRATLYLKTLGGDDTVTETEKDARDFLFGSLDVPLINLETSLRNYVSFLSEFIMYR